MFALLLSPFIAQLNVTVASRSTAVWVQLPFSCFRELLVVSYRSAEISHVNLVAAVAPSEALADLMSCLRLRYLQEVGYTDTILDVKSQRVRALLGLAGDTGDKPSDKKTEPMVNGTEPSSLKDSGMVRYDARR